VSPDLNGRTLDGLPGNAERIDLQALLEEDGTVTLQYAPGQSGACDEDGTVTTEPRNPRVRGDRCRLGRRQHRLRIRPHHLPAATDITVWDSTSEIRYLVLPMRPESTDGMAEADLAALVTRDGLIGTAAV
jgi:hypothetical protein